MEGYRGSGERERAYHRPKSVHKVVNYDRQVDRHFNDEKGLDRRPVWPLSGRRVVQVGMAKTGDLRKNTATGNFLALTLGCQRVVRGELWAATGQKELRTASFVCSGAQVAVSVSEEGGEIMRATGAIIVGAGAPPQAHRELELRCHPHPEAHTRARCMR